MGHGATNEVSANGPTRNPWNLEHITGGSSGGSGAALATRMVPAALGTDTGGSVRIPSAGCGVCGIKPTFGRVGRYGILPLSWSLDVAGPMARSAADLKILLRSMEGADPNDPTTVDFATAERIGDNMPASERVKLAIPNGPGFEKADDVSRAFQSACDVFVDADAQLCDVQIGGMKEGFSAWKIILHAEAATYHAHFLETSFDDYSSNVRIQLEAGRCLSAVDYLKAQQFRTVINNQLNAVLERFDAIALPTLPVTAPKLGQKIVTFEGKEVTSQDAMTYIAWLANFTGLPAVSIPCGFGDDGMPVGMTLIGKAGADYNILRIADAFQNRTDWHARKPSIS